MSRKITVNAVEALVNARNFKNSNTEVIVKDGVSTLVLFGNTIAYMDNKAPKRLRITSCGYPTRTTVERLNGLDGVQINIKKGQLYLHGKEWDGSITTI